MPFAIPGDVVDVQPYRKRKSFAEGKVMRFVEYSKDRVEPVCEHFGICGGCKWQMLPYELQLKHKQQQVVDNLTRIGKVELPEVMPILGAPETTFYRNKLEFTFSNKRWLTEDEVDSEKEFTQMNALGFHIPKMFDKVLDINKCWLQTDVSNQIRNSVREFCLQHNFEFFDLREQTGLMRTLIIRTTSTGELMVIVVFFEDDEEKRNMLMQHLGDTFPQITSLLYIINEKRNDTITDQEVVTWKGNDCIHDEMEGLKFKLGP